MHISAALRGCWAAPDSGRHYPNELQRLKLPVVAMASLLLAFTMPALAADPPSEEQPKVNRISGPHVKDNLAIYFIHGPSRKGPVPLTLAEALRQGSVMVHETGQVEQLLIENSSDREVFVQAGDIVKGGRQDRVLTISLLLPPKSGKIGIGSYCVEQGRWSRRGGESAKLFGSSEAAMPSKAAKIAILSTRRATATRNLSMSQAGRLMTAPHIQNQLASNGVEPLRPPRGLGGRTRSIPTVRIDRQGRVAARRRLTPGLESPQQEVWRNVAEIQRKLSKNLAAGIRSKQSESSLQLSLEHQKLVEARRKLAAALLPLAKKDKDIVGYAFAINGQINSAEIYPSNGLFRKMWPKLIKANVTEAISEQDAQSTRLKVPEKSAIRAFLDEASTGKAETTTLGQAKLKREQLETDRALSLATRRTDGSMVHRSILAR